MLLKDIFIGQTVGFKSSVSSETITGTVLCFDEEFPDTHIVIKVSEQEHVRKRFNNVLGVCV